MRGKGWNVDWGVRKLWRFGLLTRDGTLRRMLGDETKSVRDTQSLKWAAPRMTRNPPNPKPRYYLNPIHLTIQPEESRLKGVDSWKPFVSSCPPFPFASSFLANLTRQEREGVEVCQLSNISPTATREQIHQLCSAIGRVDELKVYPSELSPAFALAKNKMAFVKFR